jgi:hypothetical protein
MLNHLPRVFRTALISTLVLAIGLIIWWKVEHNQEKSSAALTTDTAPQPSVVAVDQAQESPAPVDESRAAHITFNGVTRTVSANERDEYHRLIVPASTNLTAVVPFAEAEPGELIPVQADDGGLIQGLPVQGNATVDNNHKVTIAYQVPASDGMHRVTLRRGGEIKVLEFWVGPEAPVLVRK